MSAFQVEQYARLAAREYWGLSKSLYVAYLMKKGKVNHITVRMCVLQRQTSTCIVAKAYRPLLTRLAAPNYGLLVIDRDYSSGNPRLLWTFDEHMVVYSLLIGHALGLGPSTNCRSPFPLL